MALTVKEANAASTLLRWVLDPQPEQQRQEWSERAEEAAKVLAESVNKRLQAGVRPEQVEAEWPTAGGEQ